MNSIDYRVEDLALLSRLTREGEGEEKGSRGGGGGGGGALCKKGSRGKRSEAGRGRRRGIWVDPNNLGNLESK